MAQPCCGNASQGQRPVCRLPREVLLGAAAARASEATIPRRVASRGGFWRASDAKQIPAGRHRGASGLGGQSQPGTEVHQGSGHKGHPAGGTQRSGILCVACKSVAKPHMAASLLSFKSQLNLHPSKIFSDPQSKIASPSFTSSHFIFFRAFSLSDILLIFYCLTLPIRMIPP